MRKKYIGILLLIASAFLLLTGCGGALRVYNVTLSGHIKDFEDNGSVSGAAIYIDSVLKGTTKSDGSFQINYSTFGTTTLTIIHPDYITKRVTRTDTRDGSIDLVNNIIMYGNDYSGSISGNVGAGVPLPANINTSNSNVKVIATIKDEDYNGSTVYWIYSDIASVNSQDEYYIEHAKTGTPLTVIAVDDYDNDNYIEADEFFGYTPITGLNENEHRTDVNVDMTIVD